MTDLTKKLTQEANDQFHQNSKFALESSSYSAWKIQFDSEIKKVADNLTEANYNRIKDFLNQEVDSTLAVLRQKFRTVGIPLEDQELEGQITFHSSSIRRDLEQRIGKFQSNAPDIYREVFSNFNSEVARLSEKLRKENVQELLQLCKGPIERSERQLQQIYAESNFQYFFESEALRILTKELSESIKSEKLRSAVAQTYIEDTLRAKYPFSPLSTYFKAIFIFLVLAGGGVLVISIFGKVNDHPLPPRNPFQVKKRQ